MNSLENLGTRLSGAQIREVAQNANWKGVFAALGFVQSGSKSKPDDWWALSPFATEKTASFHIDSTGFYYCFASGLGGDMVDLVQRIVGCGTPTEAAFWLLDAGLSCLDRGMKMPALARKSVAKPQAATSHEKRKNVNIPIRQSLLPLLSEQGQHEQFIKRGIGVVTCERLGCGFLSAEKLKRPENSMANKIVFQVRGVRSSTDFTPVTLSHIGRATTPEQEAEGGKWTFYKGFTKSLELYGLDLLLNDPRALEQARACGHVVLVEGCFDLAKLSEAGIYNVLATFGVSLSAAQCEDRLKLVADTVGLDRFLIWYDRDNAGTDGQKNALKQLLGHDLQGEAFRWDRCWSSGSRTGIALPDHLQDVCDFSVSQLKWLRGQGVV